MNNTERLLLLKVAKAVTELYRLMALQAEGAYVPLHENAHAVAQELGPLMDAVRDGRDTHVNWAPAPPLRMLFKTSEKDEDKPL